jgi:hypothetical protein
MFAEMLCHRRINSLLKMLGSRRHPLAIAILAKGLAQEVILAKGTQDQVLARPIVSVALKEIAPRVRVALLAVAARNSVKLQGSAVAASNANAKVRERRHDAAPTPGVILVTVPSAAASITVLRTSSQDGNQP